jgi:hypothetical protein
MIQYIIKVALSATLIVVVSEASKKSSLFGGIFASVPLRISQLSVSIFWLVIPSLSLFLVLPLLLKWKVNFYAALSGSIFIMILFYYAMVYLLGKFGINL